MDAGGTGMPDAAYWAFVCNPNKWAIEKFLSSGKLEDDWGIDRHARQLNRCFREGQFAVVRVGTDRRSKKLRDGSPKLLPGVYALCKILPKPNNADPFYDDLSDCPVYKGFGRKDAFTYDGKEIHSKNWPTVRVRYIRNYLSNPLLIDRLPSDLDKRFLTGPRPGSIRLSDDDFQKILTSLKETEETLRIPSWADCVQSDQAAEDEARELGYEELRQKALAAGENSPERQMAASYYYVRNKYVSAYVKRASKGYCDLCHKLAPFNNKDGTPYLECHHVVMLSDQGTDTVNNAVALCPNCHRQVHLLKCPSDNDRLRDRIKERESIRQ